MTLGNRLGNEEHIFMADLGCGNLLPFFLRRVMGRAAMIGRTYL